MVGLAIAMLAAAAGAQSSGPAKMIVMQGNAMAITDYPTMARCEAARATFQTIVGRENAASPAPQTLPGGGTVFSLPLIVRTLCTPG